MLGTEVVSKGVNIPQLSQWVSALEPQRRWRSRGGLRFGPKFHHFPTEVKVDYPPRDRSRLWKLPISEKVIFVTNGWYYPGGRKDKNKMAFTPVLTFAQPRTHNHLDSFLADEIAQFETLIPAIRAEFAACKKTLKSEEEADTALAHVYR